MGIDYTKRPKQPEAGAVPPPPPPPPGGMAPPPPPPAGMAPPPPPGMPLPDGGTTKVVLTKAAPTISLTKHAGANGTMRVNLNWTARPDGGGGGGFFKRLAPSIDLDLGCLYEFTDGSKGVVQALGNAFVASPRGVNEPVIRLDGDDRSGSNSGGENLFINLAYTAQIRRIMVFAFIYEGVPNWAAANGIVTLFPANGPQVEVRLDDPRDGARMCGIALLENTGGELTVRREVNYLNGGQRALDEAYGWGMRWQAGRK